MGAPYSQYADREVALIASTLLWVLGADTENFVAMVDRHLDMLRGQG